MSLKSGFTFRGVCCCVSKSVDTSVLSCCFVVGFAALNEKWLRWGWNQRPVDKYSILGSSELLLILLILLSWYSGIYFICVFCSFIVTIQSIGEQGKFCINGIFIDAWPKTLLRVVKKCDESTLQIIDVFHPVTLCHASLQLCTCSSFISLSSCLCGLTGRPSLPNLQTLPKRYRSNKIEYFHCMSVHFCWE